MNNKFILRLRQCDHYIIAASLLLFLTGMAGLISVSRDDQTFLSREVLIQSVALILGLIYSWYNISPFSIHSRPGDLILRFPFMAGSGFRDVPAFRAGEDRLCHIDGILSFKNRESPFQRQGHRYGSTLWTAIHPDSI